MQPDYLHYAMRECGRVELRHQSGDRWVSGQFSDLAAMRAEIDRRKDGGNLFISLNAPRLANASNAMTDRALRDDDIAIYTRLAFDFDPVRPAGVPSTDAELFAAVAQRDRTVSTLLRLGWPVPASGMSGNGAHALYRWRAPTTSDVREMLTTLYTGMCADFSTEHVYFDRAVRNPGRIWRLYGSINRKGAPTLTRPHRRAMVSIPGHWEAVSLEQVEQLASSYARRTKSIDVANCRPAPAIRGVGDLATLDVAGWFHAHGAYRRYVGGGMHAVRCPWEHEHTTPDDEGSTSTVVWEGKERLWPNFKCLHAHCDGRGIRDVLGRWDDADRHCARHWQRAP